MENVAPTASLPFPAPDTNSWEFLHVLSRTRMKHIPQIPTILGQKPLSFYNFPIPVQEFQEKPGNGAFPAVSPLPTSKGIIPRDS